MSVLEDKSMLLHFYWVKIKMVLKNVCTIFIVSFYCEVYFL